MPTLNEMTPIQIAEKASYVEWIDPVTQETHTCPEKFVAGLKLYLELGANNARTSTDILIAMGEPSTESNKRHIRQAALYFKQSGVHVIGLRSVKGGYFIAGKKEEVGIYSSEQRKIAWSMLAEADHMDSITIEKSLEKLNSL